MLLLKKIWHIEPSFNTFNSDKFQYVSGSNWSLHKKKIQQIKQENKAIGKKFLQQQLETADYKKKLKQDIKGYIELRDSIRKFKPDDGKPKRMKSQKRSQKKLKTDENEEIVNKLPFIDKQVKEANP